MPYPISLCMIVKNEESVLSRCLDSIKELVNEIVIIDTGSTDRTIDVAQSYGAIVEQIAWEDDFSKARNVSIERATNQWVLVLDADEMIESVDERLLTECLTSLKRSSVKMRNQFYKNGQRLEEIATMIRLFPKKMYHYEGRIHEQVHPKKGCIVPNETQDSGITIFHDGYSDQDRMKTEKFQRNITLLFQELKVQGETFYTLYQIGRTYFVHEDYKEALQYFEKANLQRINHASLLHSFYLDYGHCLKALKRYDQAMELVNSALQTFSDSADLWFLLAALYTERGRSKDVENIIQCYMRCLEIGEHNRYDTIKGTGSYLAAHNLGLLLNLLGNHDLAREFFEHEKRMRSLL